MAQVGPRPTTEFTCGGDTARPVRPHPLVGRKASPPSRPEGLSAAVRALHLSTQRAVPAGSHARWYD